MINLDNIYLAILYLIFGFPVAIIRFFFLNLVALLKISDFPTTKDLWTMDKITSIFIHPYNFIIGIILLILFLILS